jgi:prepilin-type cleavage/methylation N-terminal domain protein
MEKNKKLKGFTLIELIIVMAVFGILMVAVMSIMNPLSKIVKKASLQEANSAAVDNMKRYMEGSLRYSDCIEVFVGDLVDFSGNPVADEDAAVLRFVENHYTNRTNPGTENPLTGKIRMLKIDNADGGRVTEYEWDFTAGYTYIEYDSDGKVVQEEQLDSNGNVIKDADGNPEMQDVYYREPAVISNKKVDSSVINPVYYEDYSFYFVPGYNDTEPINDDTVLSSAGLDTSDDTPDTYYASVTPVTASDGSTYTKFRPDLFSLSVMTYKNTNPFGSIADDPLTTEDESQVIFKSPFALSNINMSLVNINSSFRGNNAAEKYGPIRWKGTPDGSMITYNPLTKVDVLKNGTDEKNPDGVWDYSQINTRQAQLIDDKFYDYKVVEGDCIYFIYTLPDMK